MKRIKPGYNEQEQFLEEHSIKCIKRVTHYFQDLKSKLSAEREIPLPGSESLTSYFRKGNIYASSTSPFPLNFKAP